MTFLFKNALGCYQEDGAWVGDCKTQATGDPTSWNRPYYQFAWNLCGLICIIAWVTVTVGPLMGLFGAKISEIIMLMCYKTVDAYLVDGLHQLMAIAVGIVQTNKACKRFSQFQKHTASCSEKS